MYDGTETVEKGIGLATQVKLLIIICSFYAHWLLLNCFKLLHCNFNLFQLLDFHLVVVNLFQKSRHD
jgi:hypothetical protein